MPPQPFTPVHSFIQALITYTESQRPHILSCWGLRCMKDFPPSCPPTTLHPTMCCKFANAYPGTCICFITTRKSQSVAVIALCTWQLLQRWQTKNVDFSFWSFVLKNSESIQSKNSPPYCHLVKMISFLKILNTNSIQCNSTCCPKNYNYVYYIVKIFRFTLL